MTKATLKDVAAHAGVSYQTVSKVLNGSASVTAATEARIEAAVAKLDYRPNISAQNLRKQSSNLIGYAWRHISDGAPHPVLDQFLTRVAQALRQHDYHLLNFVIAEDDLDTVIDYRDLYVRRQVDGFILADTNSDDARIKYLIDHDIPFASFGQANDDWDFCWVDVDGRDGIDQVMTHILAQGHERIAMLAWPEGSRAGRDRERGYLEAMAAAGLAVPSGWIIRVDNTVQAGAQAINAILMLPAQERPTAVVCVSDNVAIGAMNAIAAAGLTVGEDIAVTGFDNLPMTEFLHPPLTTVSQPLGEVAAALVRLLMHQINGKVIEQKELLLKPRLIARESA